MISYKKFLQLVKTAILLEIFIGSNSGITYLIIKSKQTEQAACINPSINFLINIAFAVPLSLIFYLTYKVIIRFRKDTNKQSIPEEVYSNISSKMRNPLQEISCAIEALSINPIPSTEELESIKTIINNAAKQLELTADELLRLSKTINNPSTIQNIQHCSSFIDIATKKLRILVVDDSLVNIKLMHTLLTKLGHIVITANNGQEAVNIISSTPTLDCDLIFMDIEMPVMDGLEATRRIRTTFNDNALPIIACTSNGATQDLHNFKKIGINNHILKPVTEKKITLAIQNIFINKPRAQSIELSFQTKPQHNSLLQIYPHLRHSHSHPPSIATVSSTESSDPEPTTLHMPPKNLLH